MAKEKKIKKNQNTILRAKHDAQNPYTVFLNSTIQDLSLSNETRGILLYILSLPIDWKIIVTELAKKLSVGIKKMYRIINELKKAGYISVKEVFEGNLRKRIEYTIYEIPRKNAPTDTFHRNGQFRGRESRGGENDHIYKVNNINKVNIEQSKETSNTVDVETNKLVNFFLFHLNGYRKKIGLKECEVRSSKNWEQKIKSLLKKVNEEELKEIIEYVFKHSFWGKVITSPNGIYKNFIQLQTQIAEQKTTAAAESLVLEENLKWIAGYIEYRERVSAYGILHYNKEIAWDEKSGFEWKMKDPDLKKKIMDFYHH